MFAPNCFCSVATDNKGDVVGLELYIGLWGSWDGGLLQSMLIGLILQR